MRAVKRPVGVLGGMGPQATVLFMQQVIDAVTAKDDQDHIPLIVLQNPQVPSRIDAILGGADADPAPVLIAMAHQLEQAGAVALAMPCNTAHHYASQIARASAIPLLNMVELAADHALAQTGAAGRVGLLGSPALRQVGVFDTALITRGLQPVFAQDSAVLLHAIQAIKAHGPSEQTAQTLYDATVQMRSAGAEVICICCTEFSLHLDDLAGSVPLFDSLTCLVEATMQASTRSLPLS